MIKIAVCDDDAEFLTTTMKLLMSKAIKLAGINASLVMFNDEKELLREFENDNIYDIVILDIDMPSINGKDLAKKLRNINSTFCLAFMTAYKDEVYSAIPIGINAFIPKEFNTESCLEALTRLLNDYSENQPENTFWEVISDGICVTKRIPFSNIFYFHYCNENIILHTFKETYILTERTFEKIAQKCIPNGFYRSHRNYIINVNKIFEILDREIVMSNQEHLPLSKRSRKDLFKEITGVISNKA